MAYQSQTGESMYNSANSLPKSQRAIPSPASVRAQPQYYSHSDVSGIQGEYGDIVAFNQEPVRFSQRDIRHPPSLTHWNSAPTNYRFTSSLEELPINASPNIHRPSPLAVNTQHNQQPQFGASRDFPHPQQQHLSHLEVEPAMAANKGFTQPSKAKYSFGLYFPPKSAGVATSLGASGKTISAESLSREDVTEKKQPSAMSKSQTFELTAQRAAARKTSLEDSSPLMTSSSRSRDYFIRYSTDKAANDMRSRYSPRGGQTLYKNQPTTLVITRSQTTSSITPGKTSNSSHRHSAEIVNSSSEPSYMNTAVMDRAKHFIPVHMDSKRSNSYDNLDSRSGSLRRGDHYIDQADSGSRTIMVRIPYDQQQHQQQNQLQQQQQQQQQQQPQQHPGLAPVRQSYGTTFALTRSPTATHMEIQKSIGKPVAHRKFLFETGKNENTAPLSHNINRYKTEIEKIRTQPKFSSIAMRRASFEQSPEKDPFEDSVPSTPREQTPDYSRTSVDTAQPTVKVRKISTDRYGSNNSLTGPPGASDPSAPIRIYVSPGASHRSGSPMVEIVSGYPAEGNKRQQGGEATGKVVNSDGRSGLGKKTSASFKVTKEGFYHSPSSSTHNINAGGDGSGLADSGVWVKSYHGSSELLESRDQSDGAALSSPSVTDSGVFSQDGTLIDLEGGRSRGGRPARQTSYLSAVNAPTGRGGGVELGQSAVESRAGFLQTPQQAIAQSQVLPYTSTQSASILQPQIQVPSSSGSSSSSSSSSSSHQRGLGHPKHQSVEGIVGGFPNSGSSHSLSSLSGAGGVQPTVMSASDSSVLLGHEDIPHHLQGSLASVYSSDSGVTLRKKSIDSTEDQANKLHRRTSYLMATARDRTNTVPIEQAFNTPPPQVVIDHRPGPSPTLGPVGPSRHQSSVKLNKFFGETGLRALLKNLVTYAPASDSPPSIHGMRTFTGALAALDPTLVSRIPEGAELKSGDMEDFPQIIKKGSLSCKISVYEGKKCSDRTWKPVFAVLRQNELYLTKDRENAPANCHFEDQHIPIRNCMVEIAHDYAKKKKNVFRFTSHQECEYLFQTEDKGTMLIWIQAIKSINEPEKAEKMDALIASEQTAPSYKMSPQLGGQKGSRKLSASIKAKLATSPSMRRKKSNANEEKDKKEKGEENLKKGWKGRIPMMKSLKKTDASVLALAEAEVENENLQFGVPLEDCFPSPHNEYVPLIVELCTSIVEARGLEVIGVYRVPGNSAAVNALTEEFNRGIDNVNIDNEKLLDINVISSLLKSFFRKLPEPLVPPDSYDAFIESSRNPDEDKRKLKLKRLLHLLPPHHNETFKHMAEHLNKVASYGNMNKMDAKNLAIMFGPTLVKKKGDDTVSLVTDMSDQCRIVESIILHHEWFFSPWDQDNYIPMETSVETVNLANQGDRDDDEDDSAISTKEIISSIVSAASKKLRSRQQEKSMDSLDVGDSSISTTSASPAFNERNIDEAVYLSNLTRSLSSMVSSQSGSDEFLAKKKSPAHRFAEKHISAPLAHSEPDFADLEYADAGSPSSSGYIHRLSDDSFGDKNDELEISHGMPTSMSRDAIHNTLKRIGNDVSVLLQTFEQKQNKERDRRKREQERIEQEHQRTQMELEQEDQASVEDWLAVKGGMVSSRMPDLVSSSYVGESFPHEHSGHHSSAGSRRIEGSALDYNADRVKKVKIPQVASVPPSVLISGPGGRDHVMPPQEIVTVEARRQDMKSMCPPSEVSSQLRPRNPSAKAFLGVGLDRQLSRPALRRSIGRLHGSLDSLIDLLDRQEKRASWASSDSEDGSDLLTSITTTFDQKLQILLNPKYKLTGASRKPPKPESPVSRSDSLKANDTDSNKYSDLNKSKMAGSPDTSLHSLSSCGLADSDESFRDPSLHRSAKSDPKIGIASRFERVSEPCRAASSSPVTVSGGQGSPRRTPLPDFKSFLGKTSSPSKDVNPVQLTQPKKLENTNKHSSSKTGRAISKSEKTERNSNIVRLSRGEDGVDLNWKDGGDIQLQGEGQSQRNSREQRDVRGDGVKLRKSERKHCHRRHTVGGTEDWEHAAAVVIAQHAAAAAANNRDSKVSAWDQLQPAVKEPVTVSDRNLQTWLQQERHRGSTPDLTLQEDGGADGNK